MRSNWERFDASIQKDMLIVLTNSIKPVEMSAGKIYKVNIEQFRTVIGTAFSYYTLLKNLKEKNRA
jgi:7tm Odorant receptor